MTYQKNNFYDYQDVIYDYVLIMYLIIEMWR